MRTASRSARRGDHGETTFAYRAVDAQGTTQSGTMTAESRGAAVERLRRLGMTPVSLEEHRPSSLQRDLRLPGRQKSSIKDVAVLSRQLATMVDAGVPILRSLAIAAEQTTDKALGAVVLEVRRDVERGESLSEAFAKHPKHFSDFYVAMVASGERGGALATVLSRLATTLERTAEIRRRVVSAMAYPVIVGAVSSVVVVLVLLFLVPVFQGIYTDLDGQMPLPTRLLVAVSDTLRSWFPVIAAAMAAGWFGLRRWARTPRGRLALDRRKLRLPLFGRLLLETVVARFARTFAVLLRAGVPVLDALDITTRTVQNAVLAEGLRATTEQVRGGEPLAASLDEQPAFPALLVQMVAVGEESGDVDGLLDKAAEFYESEVTNRVEALMSVIEPVLIVGVGLVLGVMVICLYLPMISVVSQIR